MQTIELTLWVDKGINSFCSYETDFNVSDQDYKKLVRLIKKYKKQEDPDDEGDIDNQLFTEEYLKEQDKLLYDKLLRMANEITEASFYDSNDEDMLEGSTYGFWVSEDFITEVLYPDE